MNLQLKHIPCPAGDTCTAFMCIFGHNKDKQPDQSNSDDGTDANGRKRQKIDTPGSDNPPNPSREASSSSTIPLHNVSASCRSISPPPIKRNTSQAVKSTTQTTSPARKTQPAIASSSTVQSTKANKAADVTKPKKPESLNPRLIKHSPASHEIRLKLLKMLYNEYKRLNAELVEDANSDERKLLLTDQALITRVLDEEEKCALEKAPVYTNVMKNQVMSYKRMKVAQWKAERVTQMPQQTSKKRAFNDMDGKPVEINTGLNAAQEVELLSRLYTPIDKLSEHGYVPTIPTDGVIQKARDGLLAAKGWEQCDRCQQRFQVFPGRREEDGALTSGGPCNFHWGKAYLPGKNPGETARIPKRYLCCNQEIGESSGCFNHPDHVFKASDSKRLATILNFATTPENDNVPKDRAVCFDCEMGYTVHGLELIRLTATVWPSGEELIDVLVQPLGEILDLNSRFSGVVANDLALGKKWMPGDALKPEKAGKTAAAGEDDEILSRSKNLQVVSSPAVARDLLFSQISPSTPLIGHGLENDLNAMRIVHPTIIDTILLFPHKVGLPYRYGLKMLMERHLNRKIQQETGPKMLGHDSAEDARAAGDLVRYKLMNLWNDMKRAGWKLVDGKFISPEDQKSGKLTEEFIESGAGPGS